MRRELRGQRIIITGASGGIGQCLAEQAVTAGARVLLAARSEEKIQTLAASLAGTGEAVAVPCDITKPADRARLLKEADIRWGGLDLLVNNAGIASWCHFAGSDEPTMRQIMEVNFFAPAELLREGRELLMRGQNPAVVNIASMCGRRGMPAWPEYSASKFALVGLTEALRGEYVRFGIEVLLILPGLTKSELSRHLLKNEGRVPIDHDKGMAPGEVAAAIWRAVRQNRRETVIGSDAKWMLRLNKFVPRLVDRLIARRVTKAYS